MGFRSYTTYNRHDTKVVRGGRITVANGVEKRCNLILSYMSEECKGYYGLKGNGRLNIDFASSCKLICIVQHMRSIDKTYTYLDVMYALKKLEKMGFIRRSKLMGHGYYSLLHDPRLASISISMAA